MDVKSQILPFLSKNYKKLLVFTATSLVFYIFYAYLLKNKQRNMRRRTELSVEQIRKIIEDLPEDYRKSDSSLSLRNLLNELKDINEDEDWKKLIDGVQNFYETGEESSRED